MLDIDIIRWYKEMNSGGFKCRCGKKTITYGEMEEHILKLHNHTQQSIDGEILPSFTFDDEGEREEEGDPDDE